VPADSPSPADPRSRAARRSLAGPLLAALLGFAVGDALRPPAQQFGARLAVHAIDLYRATVSPALARSGLVRCRYEPSCSAFGREAIMRYGSPRGFLLTAGRILRCNPWARGGNDPVP
jgi:putative membrane protein insertion efficiency factor